MGRQANCPRVAVNAAGIPCCVHGPMALNSKKYSGWICSLAKERKRNRYTSSTKGILKQLEREAEIGDRPIGEMNAV